MRRLGFNALVNLALLLACLLVAGNAGHQLYDRLATKSPTASVVQPSQPQGVSEPLGPVTPFRPGDPLPPVPTVAYDEADYSVLLFLRSTCEYCTQSMPLYRKLVEIAAGDPGRLQLVAISMEPESVLTRYLSSHQLEVDRLVSLRENSMGVRGTPTIIIVDREGRVVQATVGKVPEELEQRFLDAISEKVRNQERS